MRRALLCLYLAGISCHTPPSPRPAVVAKVVAPPPAPPPAPPKTGRPTVDLEPNPAGALTVRITDAKTVVVDAPVSTLADAETAALLARLEPLPDVSAGNAKAPTMRAPSAPPARPGPAQPIAFVALSGKVAVDAPARPGAITRELVPPEITPQGEVDAEAKVRIRFAEPMVPVASVGEVARPPALVAPAVAGTWRWLDTRVLEFTATGDRFPQATEYRVTVPPGLRSPSGAVLDAAVEQTFATPPVRILGAYPRVTRPDSAIKLILNQDVDPAKVAPHLRVTVMDKTAPIAWRFVEPAEAERMWAQNPSLKGDPPDLARHALFIAPATTWPANTALDVTFDVGTPSREGPRLTRNRDDARVRIIDTFHAAGVACDDKPARLTGARCPARGMLYVELSNPIEPASYRSQKIQIDGTELQDHNANRQSVWLSVPPKVGRTFGVTIGEDLVDVYGQPFIGTHHLSFATTPERYEASILAPAGMFVLDPRFETPQWVLQAEALPSVRVQLFRVEPRDYFAFQAFERGDRTTPPGKRISDVTYPVGATAGIELRADLRPALDASGTGHVVAIASGPTNRREDRRVAWIQVTRLGLVARLDGERMNAWVRDIRPQSFLTPIAGANVSILVEQQPPTPPVAADADGHATLDLLPFVVHKQAAPPALVTVQSKADSAFAAIEPYEKTQRMKETLWYVTDDRFTYKPGEKVYVKGWIRWTHNGVDPDIGLPVTGDPVAYTLTDGRGNTVATGTAKLSDQGGFDLTAELPPAMNLGTATFNFSVAKDQTYQHPIAVQEFRAPAYAVSLDDDVTHGGAIPLVVGETIEMTAAAKYYAGGGLPGAAITWAAKLTPASFSPAGWSGYTFDPPAKRSERRYDYRDSHAIDEVRQTTLKSDSSAQIAYGIPALFENRPSLLAVDATVTDVDRMSIRASSRQILVHPSTYYVGLRAQPKSEDTLEAIVTDIDGNPVAGVPIAIDIEGVLGTERYRDDATITDTQHCAVTSAATAVTCVWQRRDLKFAYAATAHVADARGRTNASMYAIPWWTPDDRDLSIVPDRQAYRPGDVAKLEIKSKVFPAIAVVTFARQGVIAQRRVELASAATTVELPIAPSYIENIEVIVERLAKRKEQLAGSTLPLPEVVEADASLSVDVESARLAMRTRPLAPVVQPGADATFEAFVGHDDKPLANAEVALIVVDEAILALSGRTHGDPLAPFYRHVEAGATGLQSFDLVLDEGDDDLGKPPGLTRFELGRGHIGHGSGTGSGYGVGGGRGGMRGRSGGDAVTSRKDFRATAVFSPLLHTDANGMVRVTVKMPDSLTRFRIVALATAQNRYFGKAESTIVVQRTINARTVAPRFLTQGDRFSLPVVIQNLDAQPRTIDVAVRAANLASAGPAGKRVTVGAGQRAEVPFDFATQLRGKAVIQTIATSGAFADASDVALPVYAPATTESFATYGIVDDAPQFEQLAVPQAIFSDVGGVEVELASTQLQSLTDAYWYLYAYPYECAEQRSSRMLATAGMIDILDAFAAPGRPSRAEIDEMRAHDLDVLTKTQLPGGGWGYFPGMATDSYVSMQVLAALGAAKASGPVMKQGIAYVTGRVALALGDIARLAKQPGNRSELRLAVSLAAAGLTALAAAGVDVRARAEKLHAQAEGVEAYPVDAKARVLAILAKQPADKALRGKLVGELLSVTHETAAAATVTTSYVDSERMLLVSQIKTTALVLDALIREVPAHGVIPKLARGILDSRKRGRWSTTAENVAVIGAMHRYFDAYEKATPNYTGKLWFGNAAYLEQAFVGRSTARPTAHLDWTALAPGTTHDIALVKDGPGRMYYRLGITYAPKATNLPPLDAGFLVHRSYAAVDDAGDVAVLPDGRVKIRLGARVVVTVETLNTTLRDRVAVVDPLPAGLEAVNTRLATAERAAKTSTDTRWDYTNMRDDRSEAFAMSLAEGTHRFSYTARATTPGTFIAAPSKAEEMYSPETFGRSAEQTIVIE